MSDQFEDSLQLEDPQPGASARQVPVAEAIKYRRRAQQAESQLQQLEQQLNDTQSLHQQQNEELAAAEAQRDEAFAQLAIADNKLSAERLLSEAGVVDLETASMLLSKRISLEEDLDHQTLCGHIERLLLDKPFLRETADATLPSKTASVRPGRPSTTGQLAQAAQRAAQSGGRKDIAEYLRLRRQAAMVGQS